MLGRFKKRDIMAGEMLFGERLELGHIMEQYAKNPCSDIELTKQIILALHDQPVTDEGAAMLAKYAREVVDGYLAWKDRELKECMPPQEPEAVNAGVEQLAEEIGDHGAVVDLAERFGFTFEQVYKMPYKDVFTIWKVDAARARYRKRLDKVLQNNRKRK